MTVFNKKSTFPTKLWKAASDRQTLKGHKFDSGSVITLNKKLPVQSQNRNARSWYEICLKLAIKAPKRRQWPLTYLPPYFNVSIVDFEHVFFCWKIILHLAQCLSESQPYITPQIEKKCQPHYFQASLCS